MCGLARMLWTGAIWRKAGQPAGGSPGFPARAVRRVRAKNGDWRRRARDVAGPAPARVTRRPLRLGGHEGRRRRPVRHTPRRLRAGGDAGGWRERRLSFPRANALHRLNALSHSALQSLQVPGTCFRLLPRRTTPPPCATSSAPPAGGGDADGRSWGTGRAARVIAPNCSGACRGEHGDRAVSRFRHPRTTHADQARRQTDRGRLG